MRKSRFFPKILKGAALEEFLQQFVDSEEGVFKSINDVVNAVQEIWREKDLLSPAQLKAELLVRSIPGADDSVKTLIRQIEAASEQPDPVMGYLGKEHAYVATGLAHLYAQKMNEPVLLFEGDLANIKGTNDEFAKIIRALIEDERKKLGISSDQFEERKLTDQAIRVVCQAVTDALRRECPQAKIIPLRTGGDEFRLLIKGVDPQQIPQLTGVMHAWVEDRVAAMGLQDYLHPSNPNYRGFGLAVAGINMQDIDNPATVIQMLDERITDGKNKMAGVRRGEVDTDVIRQEARKAFARHQKTPLKTDLSHLSEEAYVQAVTQEAQEAARRVADGLRRRVPQELSNFEKLNHFMNYTAQQMRRANGLVHSYNSPLGLEPIGDRRPEDCAPVSPLSERRMHLALTRLVEKAGLYISKETPAGRRQHRALELAVRDLAPLDPSARTLMPKEMENYTRQHVYEGGAHSERLGQTGQEIRPVLYFLKLHGGGGCNTALGHDGTDKIFEHIGTELIPQAVSQVRKMYALDNQSLVQVAHHGAGDFSILMPPGTSLDSVTDFEHEMQRLIGELNQARIEPFMRLCGVNMDGAVPDTFGEIRDKKPRTVPDGEGEKTGYIYGLHTVCVSKPVPYEGAWNPGQVLRECEAEAEKKLDDYRARMIVETDGRPTLVGVEHRRCAVPPQKETVGGGKLSDICLTPPPGNLIAGFTGSASGRPASTSTSPPPPSVFKGPPPPRMPQF